jgi:hypothetical protein
MIMAEGNPVRIDAGGNRDHDRLIGHAKITGQSTGAIACACA